MLFGMYDVHACVLYILTSCDVTVTYFCRNVAQVLITYSVRLSLSFYATLCFACCAAVYFLPIETKGRALQVGISCSVVCFNYSASAYKLYKRCNSYRMMSVCPSVMRSYCVKTTQATIVKSLLLQTSAKYRALVFLARTQIRFILKFRRIHPQQRH